MSSHGAHKHRLRNAPPSGRPSWTANSKSLFLPRGSLEKIDARDRASSQKHYAVSARRAPGDGDFTELEEARVLRAASLAAGLRRGVVSRLRRLSRETCPADVKKFVNDGGPAGWSPDGKRLVFVYRGGLALWPVPPARHAYAARDRKVVPPPADAPPAWQLAS